MKIRIENFGPIAKAELDLDRDVILIVGKNNIGKSYAISLIYAVVKSFSGVRRMSDFFDYEYEEEQERGPLSEVRKLALDLDPRLALESQDIEVTREITEIFKVLVTRRMALRLQRTLEGTFTDVANLQNRRTQSLLRVVLEDSKFDLELGVEGAQVIIKGVALKGRTFVARKVKQKRWVKQGGHQTVLYFPEGDSRHFEKNVNVLLRSLFDELTLSVSGSVFDLHYLPASRSGLYQSLSAFGQIVAELSKSRTALRQKIELPGISEPLSDYYLKLSDIRLTATDASDEIFHRAAIAIEAEILQGTVEFESKTRRLIFKPTGIDLALDLSATSSMVSEISPIASYLKYVLPRSAAAIARTRHSRKGQVEPTQLLILEEPEAHLHPEIQVNLIEILAELAGTAKIKLLITSHSNYIFNKCSNLLIANKLERSRFEAILFQPGDSGSTTGELDVNQFGISDENFVVTGEDLYEERRALISGGESV